MMLIETLTEFDIFLRPTLWYLHGMWQLRLWFYYIKIWFSITTWPNLQFLGCNGKCDYFKELITSGSLVKFLFWKNSMLIIIFKIHLKPKEPRIKIFHLWLIFETEAAETFFASKCRTLVSITTEKEPGLDPVFKYGPRFKLGVKQLPFVTRKIGAGVLQPSKRCRCRCASAMKRGFEHTWRWASR